MPKIENDENKFLGIEFALMQKSCLKNCYYEIFIIMFAQLKGTKTFMKKYLLNSMTYKFNFQFLVPCQ